jgi:hypothetical protein
MLRFLMFMLLPSPPLWHPAVASLSGTGPVCSEKWHQMPGNVADRWQSRHSAELCAAKTAST